MRIGHYEKSGVMICVLDGEISIDTVDEFKREFEKILPKGETKLLLDFKKVSYIDSLGLATLIKILKGLEDAGGRMAIFGISPKINSIFRITKVDKTFNIFTDEEEALEHFE